jgi:predicted nuclease with TOPRIM domain
METVSTSKATSEAVTDDSLESKIQKLIDGFTTLKEKYTRLKEDYEKTLTANVELEDEKTLWINEKTHLMQKVTQLEEELSIKTAEVTTLSEKYKKADNMKKAISTQIDDILSLPEFED